MGRTGAMEFTASSKDPNGLSPEQDIALIVVECVAMACQILVLN
jgi:hypothetical protein